MPYFEKYIIKYKNGFEQLMIHEAKKHGFYRRYYRFIDGNNPRYAFSRTYIQILSSAGLDKKAYFNFNQGLLKGKIRLTFKKDEIFCNDDYMFFLMMFIIVSKQNLESFVFSEVITKIYRKIFGKNIFLYHLKNLFKIYGTYY